ncbi:DNA-processing protein DprA [Companilactobacillus tucceti]|nr:DNA-processing protein DprA [Companilactobacillus tucceti]
MDRLTVFIMSLLSFKGIGNQTVLYYLRENKDRQKNLSYSELKKTRNFKIKKLINEKVISDTSFKDAQTNSLKKFKDSIKKNIEIINYFDDKYPRRLKNMSNRPVLLYLKGNIDLLNSDNTLAIVGTRSPNKNSLFWVSNTTSELMSDFVIISGLAKGIDTAVHENVVNGLKQTISILGQGLDMPTYPYENRDLANKIVETGGLLVSTYPNGTKVYSHNLAARDEWQSALSDGLIVAETGMRSGTTNTINFALQQNKEIMIFDDKELSGNQFFLNDSRIKPVSDSTAIKKVMSERFQHD